MKTLLAALLSGLLFGLGLSISGMVDPQVVLGFLNLGGLADGSWNPALAGVMGGAIPVAFLFYRKAGSAVPPPSSSLDARLLLGSALFGIGWGLAGICPGPALTAWVIRPDLLVFIAPMLLGMSLAGRFKA